MNSIYDRPMFQTPQRRAGGGIMAGIAPINEAMGPMKLEDGGDLGSLIEYVLTTMKILLTSLLG